MANLDFIVAKVRGMRGMLYEGDRLLRLCDLAGLEELAAELVPGETVGDAASLGQHLTARHVSGLHAVLCHLDGWRREVFLCMLRRIQVENLKVLLRCWNSRAGEEAVQRHTVPVPPELDLPVATLLGASDMETLLGHVPVGALRDGAVTGLGDFEETGRLFTVEAGLDRAHYSELHRAADQARGPARAPVTELVGLELDITNALFVLRSVFAYGVRFNKLRPFFAPFGPRVGMDVLDEMRRRPDQDAAAAVLPPSLTGGAVGVDADAAETAMWAHLFRVAHRRYYTSVLDFGAVAAFGYLKRLELRNLIRISEHIRYGTPPETIRQDLIHVTPALAGVA